VKQTKKKKKKKTCADSAMPTTKDVWRKNTSPLIGKTKTASRRAKRADHIKEEGLLRRWEDVTPHPDVMTDVFCSNKRSPLLGSSSFFVPLGKTRKRR
jgi:hypothetical protein